MGNHGRDLADLQWEQRLNESYPLLTFSQLLHEGRQRRRHACGTPQTATATPAALAALPRSHLRSLRSRRVLGHVRKGVRMRVRREMRKGVPQGVCGRGVVGGGADAIVSLGQRGGGASNAIVSEEGEEMLVYASNCSQKAQRTFTIKLTAAFYPDTYLLL